jgi:hypothetical protein
MVLTVKDSEGQVVRRVTGPIKAGFHRVAWDLRYPPARPAELKPEEPDPFHEPPLGPMAAPGTYSVELARRVEGKLAPLGEPQTFTAQPLGFAGVPAGDRPALLTFQRQVASLQRAVLGAVESAKETQGRIDLLKKAVDDTPGADAGLGDEVRAVESRLNDLKTDLEGDSVRRKRSEPTLPGIVDRVQAIVDGSWLATSAPTQTQRDNYGAAARQFQAALARLTTLVEADLAGIEQRAEAAGAPWTPGRVPRWKP